jgi:hypothetical protein
MQMRFATIMVGQRELGHLLQMMPPPIRAANWTKPPGIWRYCVPSVSKPKPPMIRDVN